MVTRKVFRTAALVTMLASLPSLVFAVSAASVRSGKTETKTVSAEVKATTTTQPADRQMTLADVLLATHPGAVTATSRLRERDVRIASPAAL